jgi:hypothetical protein
VYEHVEAETGEDGVLELWILVHDDGDDAHVGKEAAGTTHNVLARKPVLEGDAARRGDKFEHLNFWRENLTI